MITIDHSKLQEVITEYKRYFPSHIGDEIYKWKAVKQFQDKWDIDAPDFIQMFMDATASFGNLLTSINHFPRAMVKGMYESEPETARQMFRNLYDEEQPLVDRVSRFLAEADRIRETYWPTKMHYQDLNVISTYLWARYPDKYYIYKFSELRVTSRVLRSSYVVRKGADARSFLQFVEFMNLVREEVQKDPNIRPMLNSVLTSDCYRDESLNGVVVDINFFVGRFYKDVKSNTSAETSVVKYWLYAPGEGACLWEDCRKNGEMMIGWPELGDLSQYGSREAMRDQMHLEYGEDGSYVNNSLATWQFVNDLRIGDVVFAKKGRTVILGRGVVEGEYRYDKERGDYCNVRNVRWTDAGMWITEELRAMKTLTDISEKPEYVKRLNMIVDDQFPPEKEEVNNTNPILNPLQSKYTPYSRKDFLSEVYMSEEDLDDLENLLINKKNVILQGAPGVGKTFCARRLAYVMMGEKDTSRIAFIQFHQNYSYEDFIMGYKPAGGNFELQEGVFYRFCKDAAQDPSRDYFFIIDEINRGNLSKIFGELLMLIERDYRGEELTLAYKDEKFSVPENLYIIGMMNTADRSLAMIDYALRRRFSFHEMHPGFQSDGFKNYQALLDNERFDRLIDKIETLNKSIAKDESLGVGFELGHSYFCGQDYVDDTWLKQVVKYDILPMLKEYWFDNRPEVKKWEDELNSIFND